jgi:CheY-like chemotaxis protein
LTAVLGFSSLLAERDDLDEAARLQVQRIVTASTALLSIVNDVLDFSKLEAGQFEITPRPVSPAEASRDALTMFAPQAEAKGLELRCRLDENLPTYVAIDPDRYRQILLNLVGNALKFTDSGSITLRVASDHQDEKLLVRVEDTGPGLTQAQQLKLFQRFSQVDASATRKHGGTGLGLAICKGLSEAMGGGITVSSAIGQGSCFAFHIAAPKAEAPQANEGLSDDASIVGVRLLVIDDNPVNREVARAVLEAAGAQVSDAGDGRTGAALAMKDAFDVILLDLNMPGLSGVETLALLRAQPGPNQSIPIAAFTADADLNRLGQGHTFDEVVRKPIAVTELIDAVYRLTHKS